MTEDAELLRRYAQDYSQAAFAELVQRRIDLVYAVALRQVGGDTHLAEDVTQLVFADLARKANELSSRVVLSGWLYRSAQFAAIDAVRSQRRRREREQEAFIMNETRSTPDGSIDGEKLRPVLDQVLGELDEDDRDAVALRFFEQRSFADVARGLQVSEDTARKRVARALDKLHGLLARRGLKSTTAAVGLALANQSGVAAPVGLANAITGAAFGNPTLFAGATAGAVGGALGFMSATKFAAVAIVLAALSVGFTSKHPRATQVTRGEIATMVMQRDDLQRRLKSAEVRLTSAEERTRLADAENGKLLKEIREMSPGTTPPPSGGAGGVAFVIDTSGSMRDFTTGKLWPVVSASIGSTLSAFPDVRYFIVFDADGRSILGGEGQWLSRTPEALRQVEQAVANYQTFSESNPVPAISNVLRVLPSQRKEGGLLHICVIGDEFSSDPESVLRRLNDLNPADSEGNRRATISAIQLPTTVSPDGKMGNTGLKFQALMTEAAKAHGGSFSLLPTSALQ
ncbi:MAG: sigma-70 family RNA polymerase sigma factor [Opitutaceae bacterium]